MGDVDPISVNIESDADDAPRMRDGNLEIPTGDGGVIIQFNPQSTDASDVDDDPENFYRNLADEIGEGERNTIANDLHEAISADDGSRQESLANRAKGMDLLGLQLEDPKSGDGQTQLDGLSVVTNPLLLDAVLKDWANAQAEFLPAEGPCKVEDFSTNAEQGQDELAEIFERDMNFYLTSIDTSYGPETSHMLLWGRGFGGAGIKKVYMDPFKKRPTTIEVDVKDFIVSDATKDLKSCERITHQIAMRQSVMKRMMMREFYIDVALTPPTPTSNSVDEKVASIQGVASSKSRPEDQPYTLWECQCELDLDQFAPKEYKGKGIPLPYLVTLDKDTMQILAIRRDWKPEDEECERKQMYVKYPYVPGPGFYGTGLLNILGNSTAAMTAAWRISLDSAMLAAFPAFLIAKLAGRQNSSDLTLSPGQGLPIETNNLPINQVVMNLPFKEAGPGMMALIDKISEQAKSASASADIPVGEGVQNTPVGTMLAHIETATKLMAATHKLGHLAQDEELQLIADLFRENPESFWKGNKQSRNFWDEQKFIQALDTYTLKPKSDPNVPSHIHRVMRAVALTELQSGPLGALMDPKETLTRVLSAMREDPKGLVKDPPPPSSQPNPDEIAAQAKMMDAQTKAKKLETDAAAAQQKAQQDAIEHQAEIQKSTIDMAREEVVHQSDQAKIQADVLKSRAELGLKAKEMQHDQMMDRAKHQVDVTKTAHDAAAKTHEMVLQTAEALKPEPEPTTGVAGKPKAKQ